MMSARQFCREREFPIAIFLTYSFDPLFFERIPWTDLGIGGSRRIIVSADTSQVTEAMRRCVGQIAHLGRRYVLAETTMASTFHPKLIARLSAEGGRVWLGSGNLTYPGWGGNSELATSWSIGPREEDKGFWLNELLDTVAGVVQSTSFTDQLSLVRLEAPWLTERTASPPIGPVLVGRPSRPLAPQLAERWQGRRFDDLKLCTGSTDSDGAFLTWAQRTFGVKRVTICLTPAHASFDAARLAELPLDLRIIAAEANKAMHAKFYWLSGPDGHAAVVGSANCSAAAWFGSNVELLVVYDNPTAGDFSSALAVFNERALPPEEVLSGVEKTTEPRELAPPRYRLVSLRLRPTNVVEALIDPPLESDVKATLVLLHEPDNISVQLTAQTRVLIGRLPVDFAPRSITTFAYAEIVSNDVRYVTEPRWIDNDALLERASAAHTLDQSLQDLSRQSLFSSNQQKILETVHAIAAQLLKPSEPEVPTSSGSASQISKSEENLENDQHFVALDPAEMVRNLSDLKRERHEGLGARFFLYPGTLGSVMNLLFAQEDQQPDIDLRRETWTASEPEQSLDADNSTENQTSIPQVPVHGPGGGALLETQLSFKEQLWVFMDELAEASFAESCEAARMVQALAFPLLLCIRGSEARWLSTNDLPTIATRVTTIMFDQYYGPDKPRGLLRIVQSRYAALGRLSEFQNIVGNGTLWTALLAALNPDPSTPLRVLIPQAAALNAVFRCQDLLMYTDTSHLSGLVRSVRIKNAETNITEKVVDIAAAISNLTEKLTAKWSILYQEQGNGRRWQPAQALLWSLKWGWRVTGSSPAETSHPGYIHVESAARSHPEIQNAIARIIDACR